MKLLKIFILLCLNQVIRSYTNCTGKILPDKLTFSDEALIEISVNESLVLECQLDKQSIENGCNTTNLAFRFGVDTISTTERQYCSNSLQLKIDTSRKAEHTVTCSYNGSGLTMIYLSIGENPQPIDLNCLNFELKNLVCTYKVSGNPARETITIEMKNQTSGSYKLIQSVYTNDTQEYFFKICEHFSSFGQHIFRVSVNNSIGPALIEDISFETNNIVVLPQSFNIELMRLTSSTATVVWKLPEIYNKYEFNHSLTLNNIRLKDLVGRVKPSNMTYFITFELDIRLPDGDTAYNLTIRTCVKNAINCAEQQAVGRLKIQSKKRKPDKPPETIANAFEYNRDMDEVRFYWKPYQKIANGLTTKIHEIRENGIVNKNITVNLTDTSAIVKNLNPKFKYEIRLVAQNSEGTSTNFSSITIPKYETLLDPPQNLRMLLNESLYQLTWTSNVVFDSFTIFTCKPLEEQHTKCEELINSKSIPSNRTSFIFNNSRTRLQKIFAISSNLDGNTSGMKWFTCITSTKIEMAPIDNAEITRISAKTVKLNWALPCDTSPFVTAINITYCELQMYKTKMCENKLEELVNRSTEVIIDGLVPYTNYSLELSMFDGNKTGPVKQLQFETEFGVPDAPTNLKYSNTTNNSVEIFWTPPSNWYGEPQVYNVSYINRFESHFHSIGVYNNFIVLKNLRGSAKYKIRVAACHTICSPFSNEIEIKTTIGIPGPITNIRVDDIYEWSPPIEKNGDFQLYEVKFDVAINGKMETRKSLTAATKCTWTKDICNYNVSIRAININATFNRNRILPNTKRNTNNNCIEDLHIDYTELCSIHNCIPGNWMKLAAGKCFQSYTLQIVFYTYITLTIIGILIFGTTIVKKWYKMIKDIHASMPSGLETIFELDRKQDEQSDTFDNIISDMSQTINCEELQHEFEMLSDLQEHGIEMYESIPVIENFQGHQQNDRYIRISSL